VTGVLSIPTVEKVHCGLGREKEEVMKAPLVRGVKPETGKNSHLFFFLCNTS